MNKMALKSLVDLIGDTGCPPSVITYEQRESICKEYEELETKAAAYDTKEVQDAIECDRIKRVLINKGFIIKTAQDNKGIVMLVYNELKTKSGAFEGKSEIEALTRALEWVEGENK